MTPAPSCGTCPACTTWCLTTGGFDFALLVRVADVETLRDVVLDRLQAMPEVRSTQTVFVLDEDGGAGGPLRLDTM